MSSILQALKKLEEDGSGKNGVQEDLIARPGRRYRSGRTMMIAGVTGILLVSSVTAGIILYQPEAPSHEVAALTDTAPQRPAENTFQPPIPARMPPSKAQPRPQIHTGTAPQPGRVSDGSRPAMTEAAPARMIPQAAQQSQMPLQMAADRPPAPEQEASSQFEIPPPDVPEPGMQAQVTPAPETRPLTQAPQPMPQTMQASPDITNIIKDDSLKLQAISWNPDREKRMAVIDGRICREGESVGDYMIKQINPDDVVLSKAGITGKIVFK